jgi:hypothetical protein
MELTAAAFSSSQESRPYPEFRLLLDSDFQSAYMTEEQTSHHVWNAPAEPRVLLTCSHDERIFFSKVSAPLKYGHKNP